MTKQGEGSSGPAYSEDAYSHVVMLPSWSLNEHDDDGIVQANCSMIDRDCMEALLDSFIICLGLSFTKTSSVFLAAEGNLIVIWFILILLK